MRALMAVGPEVSGVLVDICCELKGLEEAEQENGWPQRAGKVVLQIALTRLARHYGLIGDGAQRPARRSLRHWGSEDYRPTIDAWRKEPGFPMTPDGSSCPDLIRASMPLPLSKRKRQWNGLPGQAWQ